MCKNFEKTSITVNIFYSVIVPAESLYVDEVTFPHVHDIIDAVGISRESLSDLAMESVSILLF